METKVKIGDRYGRLVVVEQTDKRRDGCIVFLCECDCGKMHEVASTNLTRGKVRSCGCSQSVSANMSRTPTYKTWAHAKDMCYNANNRQYKNYGARGIRMCERWRDSFKRFLEDMGERPSKAHCLCRIDINGHYEPKNCKWDLHIAHGNNRRNNRRIELDGVTYTVAQFARTFGINYSTVMRALRNEKTPSDILDKYVDK